MACIYGALFDTRTYGPYVPVSKSAPVYTDDRYALPVHMGRVYEFQKCARIYRP